jgi:hypothetical protein
LPGVSFCALARIQYSCERLMGDGQDGLCRISAATVLGSCTLRPQKKRPVAKEAAEKCRIVILRARFASPGQRASRNCSFLFGISAKSRSLAASRAAQTPSGNYKARGTSLGMTARFFPQPVKPSILSALFAGLPFDFAREKKACASTGGSRPPKPDRLSLSPCVRGARGEHASPGLEAGFGGASRASPGGKRREPFDKLRTGELPRSTRRPSLSPAL